MRKIEFRGKTRSGEWIYGNLTIMGIENEIAYIIESFSFYNQVDINTIGQFTGLKDKSGKKIFEGDIVKIKDIAVEHCVEFYDGGFVLTPITNAYSHAYLRDYYKDIEIVSNIYDTPKV